MGYRYATERADHTDLASGYVLRSAPGHPGFPVRLASELLQRAAAHLEGEPVRLWDPFCGSGHLVTVLGLLHRDRVAVIHASDVDPGAVELAARNLALLTARGLADRERELRAGAAELGKPALTQRADAAARLARRLSRLGGDLPTTTRVDDAFAPATPPAVDLVVTDVPYGDLSQWSGAVPAGGNPLAGTLRALAAVLPDRCVVAVTARARKVALPGGAAALERVRVGNRAAALVRAGALG